MSGFSVKVSFDGAAVKALAEAMALLGEQKAKTAYSRAINRIGGSAIVQTSRALAGQTGLPVRVAHKALANPVLATPSTLEFFKGVRGGDVGLKYFGARETLQGVSAAPFNRRQIFEQTFIKGGRFPHRRGVVFHGHVLRPADPAVKDWGRPFKVRKSGVILPEQLVQGRSKTAFERAAMALPVRIEHEIRVITKGIVS